MKKRNFIGVVYRDTNDIKRGEVIEVYTEQDESCGYSTYVLVDEVSLLQKHIETNDKNIFNVVSLQGYDVSEHVINNEENDTVSLLLNILKEL